MIRRNCCLFLVLFAGGCAAERGNPSFPVSLKEASRAIDEMRADAKGLDRPLVILCGFTDPGIGGAAVTGEMRRLFRDRRIINVSFFFCGSFDSCRKCVIEAVDRAFPCGDPEKPAAVDVIG